MIIKVIQTASNIKQSYDVIGDELYFHGEAGSLSTLQDIILSNKDETISGSFDSSDTTNYIYRRLFSPKAYRAPRFCVYINGETAGKISLVRCGYRERFFFIEPESGIKLNCYIVAKDAFKYCCIYDCAAENQIALIETYLSVSDFKYTHKVYILDEYNDLAKIISFFAVYYSSNEFSKRFHLSSGSTWEKSWTISKFNNKYDPSWRENNFPDEDFFGKTHLYNIKP